MKELTLNIPESWDEVPVKMFMRLSSLEGNVYDRMLTVISILSGEDEDDLKMLPATWLESEGILKRLEFMSKEPEKVMPSEKLTLGGKRYDVGLYPAKWTAAQYLDYGTVMADEGGNKIPRLIACFTVPEGKTYGEGYDYSAVVEEISEKMPITVALGYAGFFLLQLKSFAKAIQRYTDKKNGKSTRRLESRLYRKARKAGSTRSGTAS